VGTEPKYRQCRQCGAWSTVNTDGAEAGECRRHAPAPIVAAIQGPAPIGGARLSLLVSYPIRKATDGCAESIDCGCGRIQTQ
jgi:hypothetical protein